MAKLLTIAIPTYNRALKLEKQLAWLDRNIVGVEHQCEVVISDNASTDITPAVCRRWQAKLSERGVECRINRNEQNLGPLPNIACCIELSTSRFSWVIGDDDEIPEEKLVWVIARLEADPDLASIVLNFEGVGKSVYERCFHHPADLIGEGQAVMGECLKQAYFGLAFMTAQIYRTEYAQAALRAWPEGTSNYDYQVFLTAYAGLQGKVLATSDTHCKYVTGDNVYEKNKRVGLMLYADSLQVFLKLSRFGYAPSLCRQVALRHLWQLKRRFITNALQCSPLLTVRTIARTLTYLVQLGGSAGATVPSESHALATETGSLPATQIAH
ncbi:MAG: glycosyltransferase [Anaerolineae bacterium]|nr:glycosyltransferase [Phycisphaerae bacterium]